MQKDGEYYFKKVNSESVVQLVINSLTEAMVKRKLRPGDKLPTELELAESFGVGRNSVREAIKILEYLGVLEIRRAEGTFICEGFHESMIDPMIYGIILDTSDSYENLTELRELMEVGVMQVAMGKYTQDDLENLAERLEQMRLEIVKGAENVDNIFEADNKFHNTISKMGNNPLIDKINRVVRMLTHSIRYETVKTMIETGRGKELYEAHEQLYRIMDKRDPIGIEQLVRKTYFTEIGLEAIEE